MEPLQNAEPTSSRSSSVTEHGASVVRLLASAAASSSSAIGSSEGTSSCAWCLRENGVTTAPGSARCHDLQREFGCHKCGRVGCWDAGCTRFPLPRPDVADAPVATGTGDPHMFERTPVRIYKERGTLSVYVEFSGHRFVKGFASGLGCNCLIETLLARLNDNSILCVANILWIRSELRKLFPQGENWVSARNYLDLRNHRRPITDRIGVSARQHGCDTENQIYARNFTVTAVLEDTRVVSERNGNGPIELFILNERVRHFVPLLRDRIRR